jgi:uncharacterized membrane-anchored protein
MHVLVNGTVQLKNSALLVEVIYTIQAVVFRVLFRVSPFVFANVKRLVFATVGGFNFYVMHFFNGLFI